MILRNLMVALTRRACKLLPICLVLAGVYAVSQTGTPAPPNPIQPNPIQTTQSQAGKPEYVIRARVPLTIVDVVVTDAKGKPVHGLKQSDFTVMEDGKEVQPKSFEEHRTDDPAAAARTPTLVKKELGPNTFSNSEAQPSDRPLNVLLLDSLNTPMTAQSFVLQQMTGFLDKLPAGIPLEIVELSPKGLAILQGLTADRELLKAAISGKNGMPKFVPLGDPDATTVDGPQTLEEEGALTAARAQTEISSMRQIARYLGGMPGRKNLLWFSGGFPQQFPPQPPDPDLWPISVIYDDGDAMKAAGDLLARAHVAVYPVDVRALEFITLKSRRGELHVAEHGTMDDLADQTGGRAFYNTNGVMEAASTALDEGANFYTVTYTPLNQVLDTRFRTISVKVDQPGLKLVYRDGYYAVDPGTTLAGKKVESVTAMQSAMMRGALQPTQILFQVKVAQAAGTEMTLPVSNKPDAKQMKPPYRHYSVAFLVDVNNIEFSQSMDGNYRGDFEFGVMVYNADGDAILNSASKTVSPILPPAVYQSMRRGGANAHLEIDVPSAGDYFLRIGVHDLISDRVGAVEIPVSSITPEAQPAVAAQR